MAQEVVARVVSEDDESESIRGKRASTAGSTNLALRHPNARSGMSTANDELGRNIAAAGVAGSAQITIFNPLDCLRIRQQVVQSPSAPSLVSFTREIIKHEGWWTGLHRPGLILNQCSVGITQGLRMGLYPSVRDAIAGDQLRPDLMAISGLLTGSLAYFIAAPTYLLKVKQQASVQLKTDLPWPSTISGFWHGCGPLVVRGALITAGQMAGYDGTKKVCLRHGILQDGPFLHVAAATVAGFSACTFSAPADVVQTRLQSGVGTSIMSCVQSIMRDNGVPGFFRGWTANVLRLVPTFIVGTTIYEQVRAMMGLSFMK